MELRSYFPVHASPSWQPRGSREIPDPKQSGRRLADWNVDTYSNPTEVSSAGRLPLPRAPVTYNLTRVPPTTHDPPAHGAPGYSRPTYYNPTRRQTNYKQTTYHLPPTYLHLYLQTTYDLPVQLTIIQSTTRSHDPTAHSQSYYKPTDPRPLADTAYKPTYGFTYSSPHVGLILQQTIENLQSNPPRIRGRTSQLSFTSTPFRSRRQGRGMTEGNPEQGVEASPYLYW